jgi:hypothetical protein
MNNNEKVRQIIGKFTQSTEFAVEVANLGKKPEDRMTIEQWPKVAMSQPRLYAVIEAAEIVSGDKSCTLLQAIMDIAYGNKSEVTISLTSVLVLHGKHNNHYLVRIVCHGPSWGLRAVIFRLVSWKRMLCVFVLLPSSFSIVSKTNSGIWAEWKLVQHHFTGLHSNSCAGL